MVICIFARRINCQDFLSLIKTDKFGDYQSENNLIVKSFSTKRKAPSVVSKWFFFSLISLFATNLVLKDQTKKTVFVCLYVYVCMGVRFWVRNFNLRKNFRNSACRNSRNYLAPY